ncbi:MAG: MoaD/ThiS family protein [Gemmatimonadetes bacterium]|nr:MoaD/ThiS family protein [Gemmatimonadota bacterium]
MSVTVRIPTPLRKLTGNQSEIEIDGETVESLIGNMEASYPGIKDRICDESGKVRRFINIYINEEDIRFLHGTDTAVKAGDRISIVPAIAGGLRGPGGLGSVGGPGGLRDRG